MPNKNVSYHSIVKYSKIKKITHPVRPRRTWTLRGEPGAKKKERAQKDDASARKYNASSTQVVGCRSAKIHADALKEIAFNEEKMNNIE